MAPILGKPMIQRVLEAAAEFAGASETIVATCDLVIKTFVEGLGHKAVMTSSEHERASDRCREAVAILESELGVTFDLVVMVQGDEPMLSPQMLHEAVYPFQNDPNVVVSNLRARIKNDKEFLDRNCIKVVCDKKSDAIYMSRKPIPNMDIEPHTDRWKQVCIIPFRRDFLDKYSAWTPTPLEIAESIDMLRVIENGYKVRMVETQFETFAVDTPQDLEKVENILRNID